MADSELVLSISERYVKSHGTCRSIAREFGVSKSFVHTCLTVYLPKLDKDLFQEAKRLRRQNSDDRASRGGLAVQRIYRERRNKERIDPEITEDMTFEDAILIYVKRREKVNREMEKRGLDPGKSFFINLAHRAGKSLAEIAVSMGMTEDEVKEYLDLEAIGPVRSGMVGC